jgi:hypothetical protein
MPKKASAEDARIIMQLYDLRREAEMRKARAWYAGWWPRSADDVLQVLNAFGTPENAWFRQVNGYWDMAASFVLRGAVNEERVEKVASRTKDGRERLQMMLKRAEARRTAAAKA